MELLLSILCYADIKNQPNQGRKDLNMELLMSTSAGQWFVTKNLELDTLSIGYVK